MSYAANLDGNLAALNAHMRELDRATKSDDAANDARVELETDLKSFDEAITDLCDTLAYWNLSDAELASRSPAGGIYRSRLETKRRVALRAMKSLQRLIVRPIKSLNEDERAIRALIELESESWVEGREEELQIGAAEARECAAEDAADARRDEEALANYLNGRGEL